MTEEKVNSPGVKTDTANGKSNNTRFLLVLLAREAVPSTILLDPG
jgi:hypothetical protein